MDRCFQERKRLRARFKNPFEWRMWLERMSLNQSSLLQKKMVAGAISRGREKMWSTNSSIYHYQEAAVTHYPHRARPPLLIGSNVHHSEVTW